LMLDFFLGLLGPSRWGQ